MIAGKQEQIMQQFGLGNPVVTPAMYIRTIQKIIELSGFKDASSYFQTLPADYQMPQEDAPKPTPEEVLAHTSGLLAYQLTCWLATRVTPFSWRLKRTLKSV